MPVAMRIYIQSVEIIIQCMLEEEGLTDVRIPT